MTRIASVQEVNIDDLEKAPPAQLEVVALRCEANACDASASGLVPLELISSTGKAASEKRKTHCTRRVATLAKGLQETDAALAKDLSDPRFRALVLPLCLVKVCAACVCHTLQAHARDLCTLVSVQP